jgi:hypothetical protein
VARPQALLAAAVLAALLFPAGSRVAARANATHAGPLDRYSLVHGCFGLYSRPSGQPIAPAVGPFRMHATTLGIYLLYGTRRDFLTAFGPSGLAPRVAPSTAAEWEVEGDAASGFTMTNVGTGRALQLSFRPATGCAVYPEAQANASGAPFKGTGPDGTVQGTIDAHSHVMAFEFFGGNWHCGRPWHPYGAPNALPDCARYQQGSNGVIANYLDYGAPIHPHDTRGWPTFHEWPGPDRLSTEGDYYTGIERAWMGGLRVLVVQFVDNEALCGLMTRRHNPCNDMDSVRLQARDLHQLQDYIDAQEGGPGRGWFRIVTDPIQARHVIDDGKLAVVESIEVSHVLDCGEHFGRSECSRSQVDAGLKELHALGVSSFFPVHKFDNAFGGTKMDGSETGLIVNAGNHLETGSFWDVHTCTSPESDNQQLTVPLGGAARLLNGPAASLLGGAALPLYPPPPHCNNRGLTELGTYLIRQMIKQHFIIELDHMDVKTANQALSIIGANHYSGVVSSHSWDSQLDHPDIYGLGGFISPYPSSPKDGVAQWRADKDASDPSFLFGYGYGSDMHGIASQPGPTAATPLSYPFKSLDGKVTFTRERWGQRVFDLNTDGVANYGMYADLIAAQAKLGGPQFVTDMLRGAEAYLEMWERASGVRRHS